MGGGGQGLGQALLPSGEPRAGEPRASGNSPQGILGQDLALRHEPRVLVHNHVPPALIHAAVRDFFDYKTSMIIDEDPLRGLLFY